MSATDAAAWVLRLASASCGLQSGGGWRLLTPSELMALASDLTAGNPFVGVEDGRYWTSFSECFGVYGAVDMLTGDYADGLPVLRVACSVDQRIGSEPSTSV
jgi:hypothetical protein